MLCMSQLISRGFLHLVSEILLCSFLASACKRELPAEPITSNQVSLFPQDVAINEVAIQIHLEPSEGTHIILTRDGGGSQPQCA